MGVFITISQTDPEEPGVQLLRRVKDKAHRFAVSFHRQKQLLAHFHSIDYIREVSIEQLKAVSGIGEALTTEIYRHFHPNS